MYLTVSGIIFVLSTVLTFQKSEKVKNIDIWNGHADLFVMIIESSSLSKWYLTVWGIICKACNR